MEKIERYISQFNEAEETIKVKNSSQLIDFFNEYLGRTWDCSMSIKNSFESYGYGKLDKSLLKKGIFQVENFWIYLEDIYKIEFMGMDTYRFYFKSIKNAYAKIQAEY